MSNKAVPLAPTFKIKRINNFIYDMQDRIGSGFSSQVFRGTDCTTSEPVAIKVINLKKVSNEMEKKLLVNQLRALDMMSAPGLLRSLAAFQTSNNYYIVTRLYERNLLSLMESEGKRDEGFVVNMLTKMGEALVHLEDLNLIHRDIKPSNIFIKGEDLVLGDFGFCEFAKAGCFEQVDYSIGSPLYMSPQAYKHSIYSHQSDMWSLGMTALELLLGTKPFAGMSHEKMVDQLCEGRFCRTLPVSEGLKGVLESIFERERYRRVGARELINRLGGMGFVSHKVLGEANRNPLQKKKSISFTALNEPKVTFNLAPKPAPRPSQANKQNNPGDIYTKPCSIDRIPDLQPPSQPIFAPDPSKHPKPSNPRLASLTNIYDLLLSDQQVYSNLNKFRLFKIAELAVQNLVARVPYRAYLCHDEYFEYLMDNVTRANLGEIGHYMVYLLGRVAADCADKEGALAQSLRTCLRQWVRDRHEAGNVGAAEQNRRRSQSMEENIKMNTVKKPWHFS